MKNNIFINTITIYLKRYGYSNFKILTIPIFNDAIVFCTNCKTGAKSVIRIRILKIEYRHYLIASSLSDLSKTLFKEDVEEYYIKKPISWTIEEYIFGACSLRDEIMRRKKSGEYHGFINEMSIRFFMICGFIIGFALIVYCMLIQSICNLRDIIISKIHINK